MIFPTSRIKKKMKQEPDVFRSFFKSSSHISIFFFLFLVTSTTTIRHWLTSLHVLPELIWRGEFHRWSESFSRDSMMKRKSLGVLGRKEKGGFCNKAPPWRSGVVLQYSVDFFCLSESGQHKNKIW